MVMTMIKAVAKKTRRRKRKRVLRRKGKKEVEVRVEMMMDLLRLYMGQLRLFRGLMSNMTVIIRIGLIEMKQITIDKKLTPTWPETKSSQS